MSNPTQIKGAGMTSAQFDELRHFFFSGLLEQSYQMVKLKHGDEKYFGDLLAVYFLVQKEKTIQRYKFSKHQADTDLSKEQEKQFCTMINIDLEKERSVCRNIMVMLNMTDNKVYITKNLNDGTKEEKVI